MPTPNTKNVPESQGWGLKMSRLRRWKRQLGLLFFRHRQHANFVADLILIIGSGVYVNALSDRLRSPIPSWQDFVVEPFQAWLVITLLCLGMVNWLRSVSQIEGRRDQLRRLHEAFARAILFPRKERIRLRVFCHLADTRRKLLFPFCSWSWTHFPDYDRPVPYAGAGSDIFVIAEAYLSRDAVARNLPIDHLARTPSHVAVWPDIRSVIAAPIRDFDDPDCVPLGTISLDCDRTLEALKLDQVESQEMARIYAAAVYRLLKE